MNDDDKHLAQAVALARTHMEAGRGGPFGAVIVRDGRIIAEGWNEVTSTNDPTAHAEVVAIRRACREIGDFSLAGAVLYSSCEPCPMCLASAYWARISRIVYGNTREDAAAIGFDDSFIYDQIPLAPPERTLSAEHRPSEDARAVFEAWLNMPDKIPY
jgi:guanine deaminase